MKSTTLSVRGRTAIVTGAASGIGRALAVALASRGCHVALADVNEAGLAETAKAAGQVSGSSRVTVTIHRLDVGDKDAVAAFPAVVIAAHPQIDLLFNNAGVALGGTFEQVSERDFEWLFDINFWGVVRMTRAFLPVLQKSSDACIVNISSLYGIIAPPGQTAYSASKFAVRGFSNALRNELSGTSVSVLVVHPGGVATSIARNARIPDGAAAEDVERKQKAMEKLLTLAPEKAAGIILRALETRKGRVLVGTDARFVAVLERLLPVSYWSVVQRFVGKST